MCENVYDMIIVGSGRRVDGGGLVEACRVEGGYSGEWVYSGRSDCEHV